MRLTSPLCQERLPGGKVSQPLLISKHACNGMQPCEPIPVLAIPVQSTRITAQEQTVSFKEVHKLKYIVKNVINGNNVTSFPM